MCFVKKIACSDSYVSLCVCVCVCVCMNEFCAFMYTMYECFYLCTHVLVGTCECVHEGSVASLA